MFDDFDLKVNCEERVQYSDEEAFSIWYGESFEDYCDEIEKEKKVINSYKKMDDYDEI